MEKNKLDDMVYDAIVALHERTGKEWIHLKEIYPEVEKARTKKIEHNEASVRANIEEHCILSKRFKGNEKYILKEKGTGLYKVKPDEQFQQIVHKIIKIEEEIGEEIEQDDIHLKEGTLRIRKYRRTGVRQQRTSRPDYIAEEIIKNKQGIINEKTIFKKERKRLLEEGAKEQVERMDQFFENKKENEGFDILSFEKEENGEYKEKYIEVKSTKGDEGTPIDITSNEVEFAKEHIKDYYLHRIVNSSTSQRYLKIVKGEELFNNYEFVPTSFKIYSK